MAMAQEQKICEETVRALVLHLRSKRKKSRGLQLRKLASKFEKSGGMIKCICKHRAQSKNKEVYKQHLTDMPLMAKNERINDDSALAIAVLHAALQKDALDIGETGKAGLGAKKGTARY